MEKLTMAILFTLDFRALRLFLHSEVFADEAEFQKNLFHALHIQARGVVAVVVLAVRGLRQVGALDERRWSAAAEVRDLQSTWERQFSASAELP